MLLLLLFCCSLSFARLRFHDAVRDQLGQTLKCNDEKNEKTPSSTASLFCAVFEGDLEDVKKHVDDGGDVKHVVAGFNILNIASFSKKPSIEMFELLVSKGADLQHKHHGSSLLLGAAMMGDKELAHYLLKTKGMEMSDSENYGHAAAYAGNLELLKFFIMEGVDVLQKSPTFGGILHAAVASENLDIIDYLSKEGADIQDRSNNGDTALHVAALYGNKKLVERLLDGGLDVNDKNKAGTTTLIYAVR